MPNVNGLKTHEEILREELERVKNGWTQVATEAQHTVKAPAPSQSVVAESERLHRQDAINASDAVIPANNYDYLDEFVSTLEPPLSAEERARRERAAYISSGVAHLGNAIGAIGNMVAATGGAPAQKMAEVPDVDTKINAFRQHADKVRNAYLTGLTTREKLRQQDALLRYRQGALDETRWYRQQQLKIAQDREDRLRLKQDYQQKRQEALARKDDAQAKYWEARADGVDALTQSQVQANLARAGASDASAKASNALAEQRRNGTTTTTTEPEKDAFGRPTGNVVTKTKTTTPNGGGGSASRRKKPNPMGGKKKNPMS